MKARARRTLSSSMVCRLPQGAELVLEGVETALLIVRGACAIRTKSGKLERVEAGTLLLHPRETRSLDRRIARALELMRSEPGKRWTVERLARAVGLSRAAFARHFVETTGRSPLRHLSDVRLALAASLLETSDASLAEIAARVGYASEFAFSRAFKRRHGVAPGRFRRLGAQPAPVLLAA